MKPNPVIGRHVVRLRARLARKRAIGKRPGAAPPGRVGRTALRLLIATTLLLVLGGAAVAVALRDDQPAPEPRRPTTMRFSGVGFELTAPPGWARSEEPPLIPGMETAAPLVLVEELSKTQLAAAVLPAASPTLLPEPLMRRLRTTLDPPETVVLGGRLGAYYYADLAVHDVPGRFDVYAVPTSAGVATVICTGVPAPVDECARAAEQLTLTSGGPIRPGPEAAFRSRLQTEIGALDAVRERTRRQLAVETAPADQSMTAERLSAAYAATEAALRPLAGSSPSAPQEIVARLHENAATYARLAAAFALQDPATLALDQRVALEGEVRLQTLLANLE